MLQQEVILQNEDAPETNQPERHMVEREVQITDLNEADEEKPAKKESQYSKWFCECLKMYMYGFGFFGFDETSLEKLTIGKKPES